MAGQRHLELRGRWRCPASTAGENAAAASRAAASRRVSRRNNARQRIARMASKATSGAVSWRRYRHIGLKALALRASSFFCPSQRGHYVDFGGGENQSRNIAAAAQSYLHLGIIEGITLKAMAALVALVLTNHDHHRADTWLFIDGGRATRDIRRPIARNARIGGEKCRSRNVIASIAAAAKHEAAYLASKRPLRPILSYGSRHVGASRAPSAKILGIKLDRARPSSRPRAQTRRGGGKPALLLRRGGVFALSAER